MERPVGNHDQPRHPGGQRVGGRLRAARRRAASRARRGGCRSPAAPPAGGSRARACPRSDSTRACTPPRVRTKSVVGAPSLPATYSRIAVALSGSASRDLRPRPAAGRDAAGAEAGVPCSSQRLGLVEPVGQHAAPAAARPARTPPRPGRRRRVRPAPARPGPADRARPAPWPRRRSCRSSSSPSDCAPGPPAPGRPP